MLFCAHIYAWYDTRVKSICGPTYFLFDVDLASISWQYPTILAILVEFFWNSFGILLEFLCSSCKILEEFSWNSRVIPMNSTRIPQKSYGNPTGTVGLIGYWQTL